MVTVAVATIDHATGFAEDERRLLHADLALVDIFAELRNTMPLQYVRAFFAVALKEGQPISEYAKDLGLSLTTASRHMSDIGEKDRYGNEGFGLVIARIDGADSRLHRLYLTPKGTSLARRILRTQNAILHRGSK